jgi:4-amino-4-deoxy-L-arabinose transferase-like glycosyltransferase
MVLILSRLFGRPHGWILLLTLLAFGLRVWQLDAVPPGWRDDELIEALVISQKVLDGDLRVFYPDASGHEAFYHVVKAIVLAIFGPNVLGIRLLSAVFGTLTVPLTYVLARRLFGARVGLLAAALLAVSFWSLMYSRFGIRHISTPLLMLPAFIAFVKGMAIHHRQPASTANALARPAHHHFALAGIFMGLGFYTYFAARGIPLILLAFCVYLALFERERLRRRRQGLLLMFGLAFLLALPLIVTLQRQPEAEARVTEVGKPLMDALQGDFAMVREYTIRTLNMFHSDGDDEWLYNIPYRPVFGPLTAVFFWLGVASALWFALAGLARFRRSGFPALQPVHFLAGWPGRSFSPARAGTAHPLAHSSVFLLLWWLAGISPGFLSIPAGSLSHTILAQPATYILMALPLVWVRGEYASGEYARGKGQGARGTGQGARRVVVVLLALLLVGLVAQRDLRDYFRVWPERGMVRFLYRADIQDVAAYLNERPELVDFAVSGLLAGPWDRLALEIDLDPNTAARPRWYHPERVLPLQPDLVFAGYPIRGLYDDFLQPAGGPAVPGGYALYRVEIDFAPDGEPVCFRNELCLVAGRYDAGDGRWEGVWQVRQALRLPPMPVISNPPPPGVYAGPRLHVFVHALDEVGQKVAGDDGLWVDPLTLRPGDRFLQWHYLPAAEGRQPAAVRLGLYDPMTGERILTEDGRDHLSFDLR